MPKKICQLAECVYLPSVEKYIDMRSGFEKARMMTSRHDPSRFVRNKACQLIYDVKRRHMLAILPVKSLVKFKRGSGLTSRCEITRHCFFSARQLLTTSRSLGLHERQYGCGAFHRTFCHVISSHKIPFLARNLSPSPATFSKKVI